MARHRAWGQTKRKLLGESLSGVMPLMVIDCFGLRAIRLPPETLDISFCTVDKSAANVFGSSIVSRVGSKPAAG